MKKNILRMSTVACASALLFSAFAGSGTNQDQASKIPAVQSAQTKTVVPGKGDVAKKPAVAPAKATNKNDTVEVIAKVLEIAGTFPPNDLYNYLYVMKYRVIKVLRGKYAEKDILVGHYNPLIARKQVKDKMDKFVDGNVEKFEVGAKQKLLLVKPIEAFWQEAMEDEYFDVSGDRFYCLKADVAQ